MIGSVCIRMQLHAAQIPLCKARQDLPIPSQPNQNKDSQTPALTFTIFMTHDERYHRLSHLLSSRKMTSTHGRTATVRTIFLPVTRALLHYSTLHPSEDNGWALTFLFCSNARLGLVPSITKTPHRMVPLAWTQARIEGLSQRSCGRCTAVQCLLV